MRGSPCRSTTMAEASAAEILSVIKRASSIETG
jgi:hypothetical protein